MTDLLKRVVEALERLPDDEQDIIALRILEELEDERRWNSQFADPANQAKMQRMAREALEQHGNGDTEEWP